MRPSNWTKEPWHCPNCGLTRVYSDDADDYYVGANFACTACKSIWQLPSSVVEAIGCISKEIDDLAESEQLTPRA